MKLKLLKLKKLLPIALTTTFLFSLNVSPVNALENGKYDCNTGEKISETATTNFMTITFDELTESTNCVGAVVIPDDVTLIDDYALSSSSAITSVNIPDSVTAIGDSAFYDTPSLASVTIPDFVLSIGPGAFYDSGLTSVTIGNSVASIGDQAFWQNTRLTSVTFLGNAPTTYFGTNVFYGVPTGATVSVGFDATGFAPNGSTWNLLTVSRPCYTGTSGVLEDGSSCTGDVVIDNSVTSIGPEAFEFNASITSVTIPDSVTNIDLEAFKGTSLVSVSIPNSVLTIGESAFRNISTLISVSIGNRVTTIGNYAFEGNSALTSLTIPDSVTTLGDGVCEGCSALASVNLGNGLTSIPEYTFYETSLESVTIPNGVRIIDDSSFQRISTLTSVTIGNSVDDIGIAFQDIPLLESVTFLGDAPIAVSDSAFSYDPDNFSPRGPVRTTPKAYVFIGKTGFPANGTIWKGLEIVYRSAGGGGGGSGTPNVLVTITSGDKTPDAIFNLKKNESITKRAVKIELSKNKSFKKSPEDLYKYSIFNASKKTCAIQGNFVKPLKKKGTCDFYATRTTAKGKKYKYWVQINYTK